MEEGQIGLEILNNLEALLSKLTEHRHDKDTDTNKISEDIEESLGCMRIIVTYLVFDIEATYREKHHLITRLGDKE